MSSFNLPLANASGSRVVFTADERLKMLAEVDAAPRSGQGAILRKHGAYRLDALGRNNHLFVGDVAAGKSLAGLYSLVATCEARGINLFEYLVDVLPRTQDHPARRLDELLPGAWAAGS